jgi:2-isopropylmalate synthase
MRMKEVIMYSLSSPDTSLRYSHFTVSSLVDETLREGVERGLLTVDVESLYRLFGTMVAAGLREFVIGCGPEDPTLYRRVCTETEQGLLPSTVRPIFLVLLNCWEATYSNFAHLPRSWIAKTVFSFGMLTHRQHEQLFARVVDRFVALGAQHLKASILCNFAHGVDTQAYETICAQIAWARRLGVQTIRINDSVGQLYPEDTAVLCQQLVQDFPDLTFCLHCHNDRALALANQLTSLYAGFHMAEGALCGFGNRAGITPLEQLVAICQHKQIQLGAVPLDLPQLCQAAQLAEEVFQQIPHVFRPVSGRFVHKANYGVLNIPDFLTAEGTREYFLNVANLHPTTIRNALQAHGWAPDTVADAAFIAAVQAAVGDALVHWHRDCPAQYRAQMQTLLEWYAQMQLSTLDIAQIAETVAAEWSGSASATGAGQHTEWAVA